MLLMKTMKCLLVTTMMGMGFSIAGEAENPLSNRQAIKQEMNRQRDMFRKLAQDDLRQRAPANLEKREQLKVGMTGIIYRINQYSDPSFKGGEKSLEQLLDEKKKIEKEIERLGLFEVYQYPLEEEGCCSGW